MKRSTIILIIFLVLLIITPIVIVKTVNNLSPESKLKGIQTLWNKSDPNTPTRYIITEEYFGSDSIGTTINITTDADSKSTLIDNHRYDEDTIRISGNAHSSYNIIYEEEVNLIIENKNPNIKFKIVNHKRHIFAVSERNIVQFYTARKACQNLFFLRDFGNGVKERFYDFKYGFYLRHGQRYSRQRRKRTRDHTVSGAESIIIGDRNAGSDGGGIHNKSSDKRYRKTYNGIYLQKHRRVVFKFRLSRIKISPTGKGSFFRARKFYLLHAAYKRIRHTALFAVKFHFPFAVPHLKHGRNNGKNEGHKDYQQCGNNKSGSVYEYLRYVYKRKNGSQTCRQHR